MLKTSICFLGKQKEQTKSCSHTDHWKYSSARFSTQLLFCFLPGVSVHIAVLLCILEAQNFAAWNKESKPIECIFLWWKTRVVRSIRIAIMMGVAEQYTWCGTCWNLLESCQKYLNSLCSFEPVWVLGACRDECNFLFGVCYLHIPFESQTPKHCWSLTHPAWVLLPWGIKWNAISRNWGDGSVKCLSKTSITWGLLLPEHGCGIWLLTGVSKCICPQVIITLCLLLSLFLHKVHNA